MSKRAREMKERKKRIWANKGGSTIITILTPSVSQGLERWGKAYDRPIRLVTGYL